MSYKKLRNSEHRNRKSYESLWQVMKVTISYQKLSKVIKSYGSEYGSIEQIKREAAHSYWENIDKL